jgi:hypothetical protein
VQVGFLGGGGGFEAVAVFGGFFGFVFGFWGDFDFFE